ncbi:hypothetical protein NTE_03174 [Candidatus Nitrososphaera evergladensis SR1]|jgi:hypothetical protein|uniref:Uncharacterized protein n=1 Tax=Candidatus Nitrososphaera evergladensis SR1 TaxID=1459636 RepID=A0A075MU74_9ARCH|nr:hypothetical protein [Candidatus Nitrososphaera evergladensis]AIF85206.1 hypothetical protein NTE_03174 [Candidatus Nitrososphaera evergladensis SR1]
MLQFMRVLALGMTIFIASAVVIISNNTGLAYGHGCQAQGGCCTVGDACVEISASSPIYMMFAVVGAGAVMMLAFYGRSEQTRKSRLGAVFNIFI